MEVHHHPTVEKKAFKEYFLEFIMIFLAVTLGFFAESLRENISNREHAKLLTEQLAKDMQSDTLHLQEIIDIEAIQKNKIDTLFFLLQQPIAKTDMITIQRLMVDSWSIKLFHAASGSMLAIEKELSIKQFSNSQMPELIAGYEALVNLNKEVENLILRMGEKDLESFFYAHFTPQNIHELFNGSVPMINNKMRNVVQNDFDELCVRLELMQAIILGLIQNDKKLKEAAVNIIAYVRKQYDLE
jgi:hypothetical protein